MNGNDIFFGKIEAYLFGKMTADEKAAFEREMAENKSLAEAVELHRIEHRSMQLLLRTDLKAHLADWKVEKDRLVESEVNTARVVPFRRRFLAYAVAACVVLLSGFFIWHWLSQPDFVAMADKLFEETSPTVRGKTPPLALANALESMKEKDYEAALVFLQTVEDTNYNEIALLLKGECHYRLGELNEAIATFQVLIVPITTSLNRQKAEWYLLLTYLKKGKQEPSFYNLLERIISEPGHAFHREALQLKSQL